MILFCLVIFMLLAGAFPLLTSAGQPTAVFSSPLFALLLAAFAAAAVKACFRQRQPSAHSFAFIATHVAVALVITGAGIGLFFARETHIYAPVGAPPSNLLPDGNQGTITLDTSFSINRFEVEHYPEYTLSIPASDGSCRFEPVIPELKPDRNGVLPDITLHDGFNGALARRFLRSKWSFQRSDTIPRHYTATASLLRDGQTETRTFHVNQPLCFDGWRIFIMDYKDTPHGRVVGLTARHDPGRYAVIAGIWLLIAGLALLEWDTAFSGLCLKKTCAVSLLLILYGFAGCLLWRLLPPLPDLFGNSSLLLKASLGAAAVGYVAATLLSLRHSRLAFSTFFAAWLTNLVTVCVNSVLCGHPPLGNMFHVLCVLSLCFFPQYLLVRHRFRLDWSQWMFAATSALPLVGTMAMAPDLVWLRPPALQSPWFVPHVLSYMISYASAAVAFLLTLSSFQGSDEVRRERQEAARAVIRLSLPLMTFGLWSGALWAEEAWGIYWSWDPKETWALITWLLYLASLHCRFTPRWLKHERLFQLLAFAALVITFLVVNLLPKFSSSLHSYAK